MRTRRTLLAVAGLSLAASVVRAQGTIDTVAGGGPGDGSPALAVNLRTPQDVVRDASGIIYVAVSDDRRVYRIGIDGTIALVAGSGGSGSSGDGGPAVKAELVSPKGLAFDTDGSLLIADEGGRRVRRVDLASGKISTLAGGGALTGEGIPALQLALDAPRDVVVGTGGHVFIADGHRVRKLDRTTGLVTTVAGTGTSGFSDGSPAATKRLNEPRALALDSAGNLYIADGGNGRIRKVVFSTDTLSTLVNGICSPGGVAVDAAGAVYFDSNTGSCGGNAQKLQKWVSGSVSTIGATGSSFIAQISVLPGGALLIADRDNYRLRSISGSGASTNVAGNGTIGSYGGGVPALSASFLSPTHVRADAAGNIYVVDGTNSILRVSSAGVESTFASTANCGSDPKAFLCSVEGIALLGGGELVVSESKTDKLKMIDPVTGVVSDLTASALGKPKGIAFASGFVYVADRATGNTNGRVLKVNATSGAMTVVASNLAKPQWIAADGSDNVYFTSSGGNAIFKIAAGSGSAVSYATFTSAVTGLDADAAGNLFVSDSGDQVWRVAAGSGAKSLWAGSVGAPLGDGGFSLAASLSGPSGLAYVGGDLYIADALNYRIRLVRDNVGPSASAGPDQVVEATSPAGATVVLDGAASSDPDGDSLSFSWSGPFGSTSGSPASVTLPLGTYTITLNVSDGQASASDTVVVTVRDTIGPVITAVRSPLPNANGWNNTDVTVTFSCTDSGSGLVAGPAAPQIVAFEGAGQSRSFHCADAAGNEASLTVSDINIDKTAPVAASSVDPKANAAGWNNTPVTVSFAASDALSGVASCDPAIVLTGDAAGLSASGVCVDRAGNSASASATGINIDATAPVATALRAPSANANGWNNTDVTVSLQGVDNLSGIAGCTEPAVLSGEGAGQSASGTCTDVAGNVSTPASIGGINIDKTAPVAAAIASPSPNAHGWNKTNVTVSFTASDALSGVASCDPAAVLSAEAAGQSASGSCLDNAGNAASAGVSNVNIDKTAPSLSFGSATPAANVHGWNNTDVAFAFTASDNLSGVDSMTATSPLVLSMEGSAVSGSLDVTDLAGNTASFASPVVMIDKTAPVVTGSRAPLANAHGWNNTDVTVSVTGSDTLSGIESCEADAVLSTEGASQSATRSCTDMAGNTASATVSEINIDKTAPTSAATALPAANAHGWNHTDVTVSFAAGDDLSGVASCDPAVVLSAEAAGQSASGSCLDNAGNTASAGVSNVNIDKTAPSLSFGSATPAANVHGWNNTDVAFAFTASDNLSGVDSMTATSPLVLSMEGSAVSGSLDVTDLAGNTASFTSPVVMIDKTAPVVTGSRAPLANAHGWNNTDVIVSVSGSDTLSGIESCEADAVLSAEGASQSATRSCTDLAGNTASATVSEINIDKTAPLSSAVPSPSANAHGWNNTDVTVSFTASDTLSGVASCDPAVVLSAEAAGQSASGSCLDNAGNTASAGVSNVNIDKTMPSLVFGSAAPAANANGWNNTSVSFAFSASDALSGVDGTSVPSPLILSTEGISVSGTVQVTDLAGNSASFTSPVVMIDKTAPVVTGSRAPLANAYGWNNTDVTVTASAIDALSGVAGCEPNVVLSAEGASQSATRSCTDLAGNSASATVSAINIDKTAPAVTGTPARPADKNGWFNHAVSVAWSGTDALSGVLSCSTSSPYAGPDALSVSLSGQCSDRAGNQGSGSYALKYDATAPAVSIVTPPTGTVYTLNQSVAAQYSCTDNLSGIDSCAGPVASGASISTSPVGSKTFKVSATDAAGNQGSATNTYAIQYKFSGFLQPVDNLPIVNLANAGRTIPVKWQVKDAAGALVSDLASVTSMLSAPLACDSSPVDIVEEEMVATGGTVLRYEGGQFIYNWNTPKSWAGTCAQIQLTLADGTKQYAKFKFK